MPLVRLALEHRFDHIQIGGEHGFGKPEERAYYHATQVLGVGATHQYQRSHSRDRVINRGEGSPQFVRERFARDSALEGDGFEPSVPRRIFLAAPVDPPNSSPQYKPAPSRQGPMVRLHLPPAVSHV